jgi:hypothetical protein
MAPTPPNVLKDYTTLLERAILNLRTRLRYGEAVTTEELIAYLDAIENIPTMLLNYGGWHVEENIDWHLAHYDERWMPQSGSDLRMSLVEILRRARAGEFDQPLGGG